MLTDVTTLETPVLSLRQIDLDEVTGIGLDRELVALNPESRYLRMRIDGHEYRFRITDSRTLEVCVGDDEYIATRLADLATEIPCSPALDVRAMRWPAHAVKRHASAINGPTSPHQYALYHRMVVSAPGYPGLNLGLITHIMAFRS
jgi:hypothetical protein